MRALTENPAVLVLFGAARALDDPGGFTVWHTGTPVFVLCGLWALLAATRLTRGEEDGGRWDLLPDVRDCSTWSRAAPSHSQSPPPSPPQWAS